ncbi:DEAD/DEAH box helicase [Coraliomargarita sp. SDUM461004]|uniref:DEAD/DEAH box helicase n=1 Tax=Thalassobacterium sedimentorum TaxID=3041258 RepID=A0ABU1AKF3_9BACT|nr:DEAD/DEAH box helicase [Coraliomargarita sp. SDUM461004]MDQ8195139.1 DEAD/DEAH box helicase [Coraliomargarita sp. SDUM461004]
MKPFYAAFQNFFYLTLVTAFHSGIESKIAMTTTVTGKLEGLEGFEKLDIGELYHVGDRRFVDKGLAYYRQFAVEGLEWDGRQKCMTALVQGRRHHAYEVTLQVRAGHLVHECECATWESAGGCKHAVAAVAAMFLSVQGVSVGGQSMPDDYAQELRKQLGYRDVGGEGHQGEAEAPQQAIEFLLMELDNNGNMGFSIEGPVPSDFLSSFGIVLASSYGFRLSREFVLSHPEQTLARFLEEAERAGITVTTMLDGEPHPLTMLEGQVDLEVEHTLSEDRVVRTMRFLDVEGEELDVVHLIPNSSLVLLADGGICHVGSNGLGAVGNLGPIRMNLDVEAFNEQNLTPNSSSDCYLFLVEGARKKPSLMKPQQVSLELDLTAMENVAGEWEAFEFDLWLNFDGCRVELYELVSRFLAAPLHVYGGKLLSAKRRVRALCDLLRRVLSSELPADDLGMENYASDYPELFDVNYRVGVCEIAEKLVHSLEVFGADYQVTVADNSEQRWLYGDLDLRKLAMLLFSLSDASSRADLLNLEEGSIELAHPEAGAEALQRIVSVCRTLGVQVQFNEQAIRSEPLSISVDSRASGSDIDWFQLHPSIRCGDRTINPEEWQKLILGQLLIEDKDGSLIMPQLEGGEGGLEMLAELLRPQRKKPDGKKAEDDDALQVSRLEMLDWIMLRKHGVHVTLPEEAENLFSSLSQFSGVKDFVKPAILNADLRPYQEEGCAWIDFLYHHRFGACLADDMGLGKTVQTIAFLAGYFEKNPDLERASVLIVLPPSLVFNWLEEFARFAPSLRVADCLSKGAWHQALDQAQIILTTYDRVRLDLEAMEGHRFEIVVFDEAHNLKNVSAARTKAAAHINRRFTLCLTGTPVENNASEFYSVMSAAVPGIFGTLKAFKEYFREAPDRILGRSRPFILRRTKDKILKDLPKKEEHELFLEMSPMQKEIYTRTVAEVKAEVAEAYEDRPEQQAGIVALAAILRLRQVCVSPELLGKHLPEHAPKFGYMADKLEELHAEGHGALVFSQFIGGLDQMEAVAKERGIDYLRMDGRTPVAKRKEIVQSFQSGQGPAFFFISLKTGGVGLNLTRANYVFHLDPWWNPAVENQASDRAHRIGQTRSVFVQRLIMQHSIEARMLELKARKAELFKQLVEEPGAKSAKAGLTRHDFDYLLNG